MSDTHDFMDIDRREAHETHADLSAVIEGHLTHSEDEKRYLLDGEAAFARLASAIRVGIPSQMTAGGSDFGRVRITVEVIDE